MVLKIIQMLATCMSKDGMMTQLETDIDREYAGDQSRISVSLLSGDGLILAVGAHFNYGRKS
jgi:hypothetical protein